MKEEKLDGVTHCLWRPKTNSGGVFRRWIEFSATASCFSEMEGRWQNGSGRWTICLSKMKVDWALGLA
ncbi:hypothetical protein MTR_7g060660 [Medicago truncatula]|uniref:Uncharacterized protein n=1 Tax=Medicago truncatula TaxID=3880 RepID=G7L3H3_MEDTR|nr:hypothetical protein MTR_7g060660 [Medicago truncatula]